MLKAIGWWIESLEDEESPAPQELVGALPPEVREALASYLNGGLKLIQYRGYSWCLFDCAVDYSKMGSWDLTDGIWVWPQGLAHYVEAHQLILPDEFVSHALSGTPAKMPDSGECDVRQTYDDSFWLSWCAARRVPAIREGLRRALLVAQEKVSELMAARVDATEKEYGLVEEECHWARCTRRALTGRSVCAEHFLSATDASIAEVPLFTGLRDSLRLLSAAESKL